MVSRLSAVDFLCQRFHMIMAHTLKQSSQITEKLWHGIREKSLIPSVDFLEIFRQQSVYRVKIFLFNKKKR